MKKYLLMLGVLWALGWHVNAQKNNSLLFFPASDSENSQLLKKYLRSTDSAELKMQQLLVLSEKEIAQRQYVSAINKLQIALVLEDYAPGNTVTVFDLNRQMGMAVMELNIHYALLFFNKALRVNGMVEKNDLGRQLNLMGTVAGLYLQLNKPDSALYWYRQSLGKTPFADPGARASRLNNIGVFYSRTGQYDSAMVYYQKALEKLGGIENDSMFYCSIQDNIAQEYERHGDYDFALAVYRFNHKIYTGYRNASRIVLNKIRWLEAEMKAGYRLDDKALESLRQYIDQHKKEIEVAFMFRFYQLAEDYFYKTGQYARSRDYDGLYAALQKQTEVEQKEKNRHIVDAFLGVQSIRFNRELDLYRTKAEAARQSLRYNHRIAAILAVAGAVIIVLMTLYLRKSKQELKTTRRLNAAELRAREMEAKTIQQELELKNKDLTNVALHNTQLFDHNQQIIDRLDEIARKKEGWDQALYALTLELKTKNQTGDRTLMIQNNIEQVNAAFYEKLKERFPDLTKAEIELCGYLRINLSSKDIAMLRNVEHNSIKISKTRLRKKLKLAAREDLYAFIQGL